MTIVLNKPLVVESPAFSNNALIPVKYTCAGSDINPALIITYIPDGTKSLALIVDVPDAPNGSFDHWIMWNIPVISVIAENSAPGIQGKNGKGENKYIGPCVSSGIYHYNFKVYALNTRLDLPRDADKKILLEAMDKHILASGGLIGFSKNNLKSSVMPWTKKDYPNSMKNLPAVVRNKAIEIANVLLEERHLDEGIAIATAINKAKEWAREHGKKPDNPEK